MTKTEETLEERVVSLERRNARLERAVAELARSHTAQFPLHGIGPGVDAVRDLHREVAALDDQEAAEARRRLLEAELAGLGSAA
jgi:hypothetical protein